ncbi:hypothetical protein BKA67DRAFT_652640 [Truncatella angustata]|uniref:BTB domain-containing protein n=1 Tax=Truncatella angustata TaxID=152316 RepID=A0A9P8UW29_9PEZI|nr:uncharacterized protein BKA67DRAFT_652640 [Truncatella angustata]KAH6659410.1 hypothetical protein BKA67DRAFT_652640 [Truncatella angustata]
MDIIDPGEYYADGEHDGFICPTEPMTIVHIEVPDGKVYPVYAELLIHFSDYFRVALSDRWKQSETLKLKLIDREWSSVFPLFVHFITRMKIQKTSLTEPVLEIWGNEVIYEDYQRPTWRECVNLWLLGDYLQAPKLQNNVIDVMVNRVQLGWCWGSDTWRRDFVPPFHVARRVWEATLPDSPLRSFFLDILNNPGCVQDPKLFIGNAAILTSEITVDFIIHLARHCLRLCHTGNDLATRTYSSCNTGGGVLCAKPDCPRCQPQRLCGHVAGSLTQSLKPHDYYVKDRVPKMQKV